MIDALKIALTAADDKKALDLLALDITGIASFTNYFLFCTGENTRQLQAITDEVEKRLRECGVRPAHIEGYQNSEWILMDYDDLVIHIFSREARVFYDLERLWRDGKKLDTDALLKEEDVKKVARSKKQENRIKKTE
jgi:ribosome-associated protein